MIITLSGLSGTGKTTTGLAIGERFKLQLISVGEIFRMMAKNANMTLAEFGKLAESNEEIDKKIDQEQSKIAEEGCNVLIDGRLSGWMAKNADLKIWLKAPIEARCERIAKRDGMSIKQALKDVKGRESCESKRYMEFYEIDIEDLTPYHLVIDSSKWDKGGVIDIISSSIRGGCLAVNESIRR